MNDLPVAKKRQLQQLQKFDPLAYHQVSTLIKHGYVFSACALISLAMRSLLKQFATSAPAPVSADDLYQRLEAWIEEQPIIPIKREVEIMQFGGKSVRVRRDDKNELRLRVGASPSVYVGFWGGDFGHISSRAGAWKLSSSARENLRKLICPA